MRPLARWEISKENAREGGNERRSSFYQGRGLSKIAVCKAVPVGETGGGFVLCRAVSLDITLYARVVEGDGCLTTK